VSAWGVSPMDVVGQRSDGASPPPPEQGRPYTITGHGGGCDRPHSLKPRAPEFWRYMDMPWMEGKPPNGVAQAIPPAYTEWIGHHLLAVVQRNAA
jgi:hypothetical protein